MLHTRTHKSRMAIMIKQLMPECTSCVARVHSGLCSNCPHWTPSVVQELTEEMAERISATIGQENIRHDWTGEYPPRLDRRISQGPTREMLNKNK